MRSKIVLFAALCVFTCAEPLFASIVGSSKYVVQTYYANPHEGESLSAFDWDDNSSLYYSTGDASWGLGFAVYRFDGAAVSVLHSDNDAWAGGTVTAIGGRIYFNDSGNYDRWTCDYYKYDPTSEFAPVNIEVASDISGLATSDGTDFWAAGGWSASIYYSTMDGNGDLVSNPLVNLGAIGSASGPIAFDAEGNLFYAEGYVSEGSPRVYRWTAAEVAAAIADPEGSLLNPAGHVWATISAGSGATGMAVDDDGNLVLTSTSFTDPSELQRLFAVDGSYMGYEVLARSDERLSTVRIRNGKIYTSCADGIFIVVLSEATRLPVNDFDGDGKSDMTLYHEESGYWYMLLSGSGYSMSSMKLGEPGYTPVRGDFDGDGKADIAVYHEASGYWFMLLSGGGYAMSHIKFGAPGYTPVSGDFDGDGKTDIVVYHEESGYWYMLLSGSDYELSCMKFGAPGYAPVK